MAGSIEISIIGLSPDMDKEKDGLVFLAMISNQSKRPTIQKWSLWGKMVPFLQKGQVRNHILLLLQSNTV